MSTPYIGECRLVGWSFQANGWSYCNGGLQSISENPALYQLIGTTYGGDGQRTFALPDLQGRVPVHQGSGFAYGQKSGTESVTVTIQQIPIHSHTPVGSATTGAANLVSGNLPSGNTSVLCYLNSSAVDTSMNNSMIGQAGGNQPHENMQPYLVMNWIISLFGVFPSQN